MGKYGKGMRDCCDSIAAPSEAHIAGCPMNPVSVGGDLVPMDTHLLEWLPQAYSNCKYGSQDWCESYLNNAVDVIRSQAARIIAVEAERDGLVEANNAAEIDAGLTSNGNLWRFWSLKAQTMVDRATKAEARIAELEAALTKADHALMVVQCAIDEDTTALNDCLWIPERFGPNESVLDFVGSTRAALTPEPS